MIFSRGGNRLVSLPPALAAAMALAGMISSVGPSTGQLITLTAAQASPEPAASPTSQPSPTPSGPTSGPPPPRECTVAEVTLDRDTITATGTATARVVAAPGQHVSIYAYTRPSTEYAVVREGQLDEGGRATFQLSPPANTRLYAQQAGCPAGPSIVLNVRTALSLFATRNGPRDYTFFGDSLPARPGGLVISLYRLGADGRRILTAQARADAGTGQYDIRRQFQGQGRFTFLVATGQDLRNAPGTSNPRSTLIY